VNLPGRAEENYNRTQKVVVVLVSIRNGHLPRRVRSVNVGENVMGTGGH
jgi:hypothetical protein